MARLTPQWLQAGNYPGAGDRRLIGALWPAATVAGCAVTPATGMSVNIAPGQVAVPTANATGSTLCTSTAVETITLDPAPPSGTNRIDLVICTARSSELDGGANEDFIFDKVAGAPAASPAVPAVPAGSVALAQVAVTGGSASLTGANITDRRGGQLAVPAGAVLASVSVCPTTQKAVSIGGGYNTWAAELALSFVAPPSGVVLLDAELFAAVPTGGALQMGWNGGGLTNGVGAGQCPAEIVIQPVGQAWGGRVRTTHRVFGLTPGQLYTPLLYAYSGNAITNTFYYGGTGIGANISNNAGPAVLQARAA